MENKKKEHEKKKKLLEQQRQRLKAKETNLGKEIFEFLQKEYQRRNKMKITDPNTLYEFWKRIKNLEKKREENEKKEANKRSKLQQQVEDQRLDFEHARIQKINELKDQDHYKNLKGFSFIDLNSKSHNQIDQKFESIIKKEKDEKDRLYQLRSVIQERDKDVKYTLQLAALEEEEDQLKKDEERRIQLEQQLLQEEEEKRRKLLDKQEDIKGIVNKLYGDPFKENAEKQKLTYLNQKEIKKMEQLEVQVLTKGFKGKEKEQTAKFAMTVMALYQNENPNIISFKLPQILFEYWQQIEEKEALGVDKSEQDAEYTLSKFFENIIEDLISYHHKKQGFECYESVVLFEFWQKIPEEVKIKKYLDFEDDNNLIELIDAYLEDMQEKEEQRENEEYFKEQEQKEKMEKMKRSVLRNKFIEKTPIEELAKPKDRQAIGKHLLSLNNIFKTDKVIQRLIQQEFENQKFAQTALEYDHNDRIHQAKTQNRQIADTPQILQENNRNSDSPQMRGRKHSITESKYFGESMGQIAQTSNLNKKTVQPHRVDELGSIFQNQINHFFDEKHIEIVKLKKQEKKIKQENMQLLRYLHQRAEDYLRMRKQRLDPDNQYPQIPVNTYLGEIYETIRYSEHYARASKRLFPFKAYVFKKREKALKTFPPSLKSKFFEIVRQYVIDKDGQVQKQKEAKLPFWAPSGGPNQKCTIHEQKDCPPGCQYKTHNKKIHKHSKEVINGKDFNDRQESTLWYHPKYQKEKEAFLMTYDDARQCTFKPRLASHLPQRHKNIMKNRKLQYDEWIDDFLEQTGHLEKYINKLGPNFSKRFPVIFKYGCYSKAKTLTNNKKYLEAYKTLSEGFNIEEIKSYFEPQKNLINVSQINNSNNKLKNANSQTQLYKSIKIESRLQDLKQSEDFNKQNNKNFLKEVFHLIKKLEKFEQEKQKEKKAMQKELEQLNKQKIPEKIDCLQPNIYNIVKETVKKFMCPLGDDCPGKSKARWPETSVRGTVPIGVGCKFAHRASELQFNRIKDTKKKRLLDRINQLNKELMKGPKEDKWNPGGNTITLCIGCSQQSVNHQESMIQGRVPKGTKGLCGDCQLRKANLQNLEKLKQKAKQKQQQMMQNTQYSNSINQRQESKQQYTDITNRKIGLLTRANKLYQKERYVEAFEIISEAVKLTKLHMRQKEIENINQHEKNKKKLNVKDDVAFSTEEFVQTLQNVNKLQDQENEEDPHKLQKIKLLGLMSGLIGEKKKDVDSFLAIQIEQTYLKIDKKMKDKLSLLNLTQQSFNKNESKKLTEKGHPLQQHQYCHKLKEMKQIKSDVPNLQKLQKIIDQKSSSLVRTQKSLEKHLVKKSDQDQQKEHQHIFCPQLKLIKKQGYINEEDKIQYLNKIAEKKDYFYPQAELEKRKLKFHCGNKECEYWHSEQPLKFCEKLREIILNFNKNLNDHTQDLTARHLKYQQDLYCIKHQTCGNPKCKDAHSNKMEHYNLQQKVHILKNSITAQEKNLQEYAQQFQKMSELSKQSQNSIVQALTNKKYSSPQKVSSDNNNNPKGTSLKQRLHCGDTDCEYVHQKQVLEFCPKLKQVIKELYQEDAQTMDSWLITKKRNSDLQMIKKQTCGDKNCSYAHSQKQIELYTKEQRQQLLQQSLIKQQKNLSKSEQPVSFKPTSHGNTLTTIEQDSKQQQIEETEQIQQQLHRLLANSQNFNEIQQSIQDYCQTQQFSKEKLDIIKDQIQILKDLKQAQSKITIYNKSDNYISSLPHQRNTK